MNGGGPAGRSLRAYLLLPRPEELVKWIITPLAALIPLLGGERDRAAAPLGLAAAVWLGFEYLLHSARYQWNDLLGAAHDAAHPYARARGRLPRGRTREQEIRHRRLSTVVLAVRLLTAALALAALRIGGDVPALATELTLLAVVLVLLACGYEALRTATRRPPEAGTRPCEVAVWVAVGGGYAVRGATGFALAGVPLTAPAGGAAALYFGALGVMFVLLTWTLEGAAFCVLTPAGQVLHRPALAEKSHLAALMHAAGLAPTAPVTPGTTGVELAGVAVLDRAPLRPTPWILALVVAAAAGGALVATLFPASGGPLWSAAVVLAPTALAVVHVAVPPRRRGWHLGAGAVLLAVLIGSGRPEPEVVLTGVMPWLAACALFDIFRGRSYADLKGGCRPRKGRAAR